MGQGMDAQQPQKGVPYSRGYIIWAIGLVFVVSILNVVDRTIVALLVPGIQADLGLSDTQLGLLLGPSFSVVHFLAVVPLAWLADRTVRRNVIAVGLFAWSLMTMLAGVTQNFLQLFATRMGVGIGEAAGSPPAVSLLSDTAPESQRARALSAVTIGALTGIGAGMLIGGYVSR
ncbi:MAG: MFS transporter [bacterium]|nr:MFS transporter [bacterium]